MRDARSPVPDPLENLFVSQRARPAGLLAVHWDELAPAERALLAIDGTVTRFLEAWRNELVRVELIGQVPGTLGADEPWLLLPAGAAVIRRRVRLYGVRTARPLAWAESLIAADRLPAMLREKLEATPGGLGQILIDARLETRREGLWCGRQRTADAPFALPDAAAELALTRTYRVYVGGAPLMLITEWFTGAVAAPVGGG